MANRGILRPVCLFLNEMLWENAKDPPNAENN